MKDENIKFAKWLLRRRDIELTFDMDDMWEEYELENRPKRWGMCRMNYEVGNYFGIDPLWMKARGQERLRVMPRRLSQYVMWKMGYSNKELCNFYNVPPANISQGISTIQNEMSTNAIVRKDAKEIMKIFRKFG